MREKKRKILSEILEIDNIDNNRPKLSLDFQKYIESSSRRSSVGCGIYPQSYMGILSSFLGGCCYNPSEEDYDDVYSMYEGEYWNGWDEDEYDDELYPSSRSSRDYNKKKEKERKSPARVKSSSKRNKQKELFDEYEWSSDKDEILYASDNVVIKFYKDISISDEYEEFDNLYEFDEYCSSQGINVSEKEVQLLMNRAVNYCAIDPKLRSEKGELWIKSESSYGALRWECIESDDELLVNSGNSNNKSSLDNTKYYS